MMQPVLTIAIPTYNRAELLDKCLLSLASQIGESNSQIEVIVSNNASTDNTAQIAKKYENNFFRFIYSENSINMGADFNINNCFLLATGKYVWVFSDDDLLLPNCIDKIILLLEQYDFGVLYLTSIWYLEQMPNIIESEFKFTIYKDSISFVKFVNYWFTFITGNIVNKNLLSLNNKKYEFLNTNLVQLGWTLPAIFLSKNNLVIDSPIIACKAGNTGGYKIFKTFSININLILNKLIDNEEIIKDVKDIINESLIKDFFPRTIRNNNSKFSRENAFFTLLKAFKRYKSFWTVIFPLFVFKSKFYNQIENYQIIPMKKVLNRIKAISMAMSAKIIFKLINSNPNVYNNIIDGRIDYYLNQSFSSENKWNISMGEQSFLKLPLEIAGGDKIFIGANTWIGKNAWLAAYDSYHIYSGYKPKIEIGNNVKIGNYACITSINNIIIRDGCQISEYFYTSDHTHGIDAFHGISPFEQPLSLKGDKVDIGENCFIGYRVSVLPGVTLGKHCVVGNNAVVTRSFPDYSMIAGIPAKLIKKYDFNLKSWVSVA